MSPHSIQVRGPSRLHFGMLSFAQSGVREFGGFGAMIDQPVVELCIHPAREFLITGDKVTGDIAQRVVACARRIAAHAPWIDHRLPCRIDVVRVPRQHIGLGTGTQLSMAVAAGLNAFFSGPWTQPQEFASAIGRGQRSSIGVYGALRGGLLVEAGKVRSDELGPLLWRGELPSQWKFVLLSPRDQEGLSGSSEQSAFDRLSPVPLRVTGDLCRILLLEALPTAMAADFAGFSDALHRFGHLAGECFSSAQGGAYGEGRSAALVERCRSLGIRGVGQTSWGPTVFALVQDSDRAESLAAVVHAESGLGNLEVTIASPRNAALQIEPATPQ